MEQILENLKKNFDKALDQGNIINYQRKDKKSIHVYTVVEEENNLIYGIYGIDNIF